MKAPNRTLAFLSLALLAGCATTAYTPTPQEVDKALAEITGQNGRACLRLADINGFASLNDSVVSVSDKFRGHYLMVALYRCPGLEYTTLAAFKGAFTEFCGRRDAIATRQGRCPIQSVYTFENRQAAFDAHDRAEEVIRLNREQADGPYHGSDEPRTKEQE